MEPFTVPTRSGEPIALDLPLRDLLFNLDVVWANKFEGESISSEVADRTEAMFYKGAPPQWLIFYLAEARGIPFFKRDLCDPLRQKITKGRHKRWSTFTVNVFHESGSGGSTVAMQVLWDLRKEFRCARVKDSVVDAGKVAEQVVALFKAGGPKNRNTVLLLLDNTGDDATFRANLEHSLIEKLRADDVSAFPVVIIINCVRQNEVPEQGHSVKRRLTEQEQQNLNKMRDDVVQRHGDQHQGFHAFNIMQRNYDPAYAQEVCRVLDTEPFKHYKFGIQRKEQFFCCLSLLNSYVPGSSLPHDPSLTSYTDFLVVFPTQEGNVDSQVRMAHPMIAKKCLEILTNAGLKRSDATVKLLDKVHAHVLRKLLTKRETKSDSKDGKDNFSKLILDINNTDKQPLSCLEILENMSNNCPEDPFYPQVLARFYDLKMNDYDKAEQWAKKAIERAKTNSFIKDTLGQVYKHRLKNLKEKKPLEILKVGKMAAEAFDDEARTADEELGLEMKDHSMNNTSNIFNTRGLFGFLDVALTIFKLLTEGNSEWTRFLRETSSRPPIDIPKHHKTFYTQLKDGVKEKYAFFEWFLLYSKPGVDKDEPEYFWPKINECYTAYVTESLEHSTFAGFLYSLDQGLSTQDLEKMAVHWAQTYSQSSDDLDVVQKYILSNIVLSESNAASEAVRPLAKLQDVLQRFWDEQNQGRSPEFYLLTLLLFWPDVKRRSVDITLCIQYMHQAYETTYKKKLRSRFLLALFFLAEINGPQKVIHKSRLPKGANRGEISIPDPVYKHDPRKRVQGEVRNLEVFALRGSEYIKVSVHPPASVRDPGKVSFYLGFNINGPVAYDLTYEP